MKRNQIISTAMLLLLSASCVRETGPDSSLPEESVREGRAFIVVPEGTRTAFDGYTGKFAWSEGDKIAIHLSDGTFHETEVNAATGAFLCSTSATRKRNAYAVYPASVRDDGNFGSPTLNVVLPAEYDISENLASDYAPVPMIAVNRQEEGDLYFRHVGGLLRITCEKVPAGTQKIAVTLPYNIAGTFPVADPTSENPTVSAGGDSPTVTFRISETALAERTDGIILNLPVPVGMVPTLKVAALDASGAELIAETRHVDFSMARYHGKKVISNLATVFADSMQLVVTAGDETAYQFTLPFRSTETLPADLRIIWGDGAWTDVQAGTLVGDAVSQFKHTYAAAGDYTVTLEATAYSADSFFIPALQFYHDDDPALFEDSRKMLKALPTAALYMDSDGHNLFRSCPNLVTICGELFTKNPHFTLFERTFQESAITAIPSGLFANNPEALSFRSLFWHCTDLAGPIPEDLFAHCPKTKSFFATFSSCTSLSGPIPEDLFVGCPEDTTFTSTFYYCSSLSGPIPEGLFRNNVSNESFLQTFCGCENLTGTIPEHLFDGCPDVTTFWSTFIHCTGLTGSIPADLFRHQTKVKSFRQTFCECTGLTGEIPENLFSTNRDVELFQGTFQGCTALASRIPANLFRGQPKVISYARIFADSPALYGPIPAGLFDDSPLVKSFEWAFNGCVNLTGSIPSGLFSKHPHATNFSHVFRSCSSLTAVADIFTGTTSTPADRFAALASPAMFEYSFARIGGGTAPDLWHYTFGAGVQSGSCFKGSSALTNWADVPDGWK